MGCVYERWYMKAEAGRLGSVGGNTCKLSWWLQAILYALQ